MANLKNLKKKNRLGIPPMSNESSDNLEAPEHAPLPTHSETISKKSRAKTGRTAVFGTRVSPEFLHDFRRTAFENDLKLVELLEESLKAYKEKIKR